MKPMRSEGLAEDHDGQDHLAVRDDTLHLVSQQGEVGASLGEVQEDVGDAVAGRDGDGRLGEGLEEAVGHGLERLGGAGAPDGGQQHAAHGADGLRGAHRHAELLLHPHQQLGDHQGVQVEVGAEQLVVGEVRLAAHLLQLGKDLGFQLLFLLLYVFVEQFVVRVQTGLTLGLTCLGSHAHPLQLAL